MNQPRPDDQSQRQDSLVKDTKVGRDLIFAPVQIGTKIETQTIQISVAKVTQQPLIKTSPYQGLKRFNLKDRERFFGRDKLIARLFEAVNRSNLSLVLGASGSGKSSVVRAGLIPELKKSLESSKFYDFIFTPNEDPFESLYRCLLSEEKDYSFRESEAKIALKAEADTLTKVISTLKKEDERWLIFVDQFEELFTSCHDLDKRNNFIEGLVQVAKSDPRSVKIVLAMRSDFLEQFSFYPNLGAIANQNNIHLVTDMDPDELRQAIEQPAAKQGVVFEEGLVEQIIQEVEGQKGYLPLLQYTLDLLWQTECRTIGADGRPHIEDRTLNKTTYAALEGVRGALQKRVNEIYKDLKPDEQAATKQIFVKLVNIVESDSGSKAVSRRAYRDEFVGESLEKTLNRFIDENLLISSYESVSPENLLVSNSKKPTQLVTVEIAHEILVSSWDTLKNWIEEEKEAIILKNWLAGETKRWQKIRARDEAKAKDELLKGSRLDRVVEFRKQDAFKNVGGLRPEEIKFINASVEWRDRLLRQEKERRNRQLMATSIASVIFAGLAIFAGFQSIEANKQAKRANEQAKRAFARQLAATSERIGSQYPDLYETSALLAVESIKRFQDIEEVSLEADRALRNSLIFLPNSIARISHEDDVRAVEFSPDSKYLATRSKGTARLIEVTTGQEIARLTHQAWVRAVLFSPDGKYLATHSGDNTARLIEVSSGQEIARITHQRDVNAVVFSPDSKYLATSSKDNTARLIEVKTGQEIARISHQGWVKAVVFSSDSNYLATSSKGTARLIEVKTGKEIARISYQGWVKAMVFSPDSKYLATRNDYNTAHLIEVSSGKKIARLTHQGQVSAVSFSSDSKYLATGSWDKTARLIEVSSGQEIARIPHQSWVEALSFSPDGKYLATHSGDNTARLIEVSSGQEIARLTHQRDVRTVVFSPDGKYLATHSGDNTVPLIEVSSGKEIARIIHQDAVDAVSFSPDGKYLTIRSRDKTVPLIEVSSGQEIARIIHQDTVDAVTFSPDSKYLATRSWGNTIRLIEVSSGQEIARIPHQGGVEAVGRKAVTFSPDSKYLATHSGDNTVRLIEVSSGQEIARIPHQGGIEAVTFSPDSNYLATRSRDNTARLIEVGSDKKITRITHQDSVYAVAFSPDGKYLATHSGDNTARLIEVSSGQEIARIPHQGRGEAMTFSPDSKYLATRGADGTARLIEVSSGQEITRITHRFSVIAVVFSPNGKYLATRSEDNIARLIEVKTGKEIARIWHQGWVKAVVFSPDSKYLATGSEDNTARLIEVSSGQEIARITHQDIVWGVEFSPDSKYLATGSEDNTARLIEVKTGKQITSITHQDTVEAVAFSPDSKYLATGSEDNTARLIEVKTGKEIARISHQDGVKAVTFSPDSKYLATGSEDNTARLIEMTSRKEIAGITHQDTVEAVEFSPDSKYLVTRSRDNTVQLHFLNSKALMIEACRRLKRNLRVDEWQNYINVQLHLYDKTCKNYPIHPSFLKEGERLAKEGKVIEAIATYKKAQKLDSNLQEPKPKISAQSWNSLCRFGSLHRQAAKVMFACKKAVELEPKNGAYRDSRGLARALTGKTKGAVEDFQAFIEWTKNDWKKAQRQSWIDALRAGKNPFSDEEIESLF